MNKNLKEYFELNDDEKQDLWNNCVFVFDTNTLLNLYRYSSKTRIVLLEALEYFKSRIWMPYQVANEFLNRRCEVIYETIEQYDTAKKEKDKIKVLFSNLFRLKETDEELKELDDYISNWIETLKHKNLIVSNHRDDEILSSITKLYDENTGNQYSEEELLVIKKQGKERYSNSIPPGYKDKKKGTDVCDNNMYGDLIIWKQIIDYSKKNKKSIIYVTDDKKEDWWYIVKGKTIGPRVELIKEFIESTDQQFYMYSMDSFIKMYGKQRKVKVDKNVIDEVFEINKFKLPIMEYYDSSTYNINYGILLDILKEKDVFDTLSNSEKAEIINYMKENRKCKTESGNKQFYLTCPRCHYQGYSKFENECPECGNVWYE